ncbi:imidazole glycerol phosphate synthase subunit HisH [Aestuariivirga litoralis]|uniref:Imidazole glycerol phosphate synthase subunit HisH n=1 Tax=Aestuariivirga litoralis TaxID=2650924 RepID=A0A2W2AUP4_9HYPH|nr:imidazole glycerol phosphate synthase subunit HisH [Aestuariivirga litoralis]PZF77442.1 imidazole glycerol phosphate synthase subunit HisH [Aestuariivirga litoralis]
MSVAIIDYGSGNLHSAAKAMERAARDSGVATAVHVTSDPELLRRAERLVLPGVGAFKDCRNGLMAVPGLWQTLQDEVTAKGKPFLGICVGMQLMASRGLEHDITEGFGWIPGEVLPIAPRDPSFKIPHMGWNTLDQQRTHPLLDGIPLGETGLHAYFVHSYHLVAARVHDVIATTEHGQSVTAMVGRDNLIGTQFHPEKSQVLGLTLLANFLRWRP